MQTQFESFPELPRELQVAAAEQLPTPELARCAQTNKHYYTLFQPLLPVRDFLHQITRGNREAVRTMLQKTPHLIHQRGRITDCSERTFACVSGFEYALWALDKHLWTAMMDCIPSNETGRKIRSELWAQYRKVQTVGITYVLYGRSITESHFDFKNTLLHELQTQADAISTPGYKNWQVIDKQWREGVGGAQKLLPMHVVEEYCSQPPFSPIPEFRVQPPATQEFYNQMLLGPQKWFCADSQLGQRFALFKGKGRGAFAYTAFCLTHHVADDLEAMKALCHLRTQDVIALKTQLEQALALEATQQAPQI